MQEEPEYYEALTYIGEEPDIVSLQKCYADTVANTSDYREDTEASYNDRHEIWPGKTGDHRKGGAAAFPWNGASDLETRVVEEKIGTLVARSIDAMERSHIQAYPVEVGDAARARIVSSFLKWMATSWIDGFDRVLDAGANYFFEKGLMISHVGWEQKKKRKLKKLQLDEIAPEIADALQDPSNDPALIGLMESQFGTGPKRAKKALKTLRRDGYAELPTSGIEIDRPTVRACAPDADVLFPSWCIDPKRAPYAFYRDYLTPQEILSNVETDDWDEEWAGFVIEHHLGMASITLSQSGGNSQRRMAMGVDSSELIEVLWMYQRLVDEEDGAEGVYCTVFSPHFSAESSDEPAYAKRELLEDQDEFPFVVTEMSSAEKRLYEVNTIPRLISSGQKSIKNERDSRIDRNSLATLPELHHPTGRPPAQRGPGRLIGYRRRDEYYYGDVPKQNPDAVAMDMHLMHQIDRLLGMDPEDPDHNVKKAYYIRKFLKHQRDVLMKAYEMYKLYGPEELFFRVTGLPEQMQMVKDEDERLDITVNFDTLHSDPDNVEKMLGQLFQIIPLDQGGRINMDAVITYAASAISPTLAAQILQTGEEGAQKLLEQFTMDWAKMAAGVPVDAPPNGAGVILPAMETLREQSDVMEGLNKNEAWMKRVQNYVQQLQFQQQQIQNAETGKRGAPAAPIQLNQAPYPQQNGRPAAAATR